MSLISHIRQQLADEEKQAGECQCFIGHEFSHKDLRKKLEHALGSLPGTKLQPYFADSEVTGGFILEKICKKILSTRATIVDLSSANPNVYFELGLAIGLNKPIFVILKQHTVVPAILESFVKLHFTSYTELEQHLAIQVPNWLEQSIEYHLRYNNHCHFVNLLCLDRQRITPKRRYLLIDYLQVTDEAAQPVYDRDLQQELLPALERFHFEPTFLHKLPLESTFRLCDYCRSLRDSSFALCHLTRYSSLDVYFLLGLVTGLDIPSLLLVWKGHDASPLKPFEIPSMLKGLDLFEYEHYKEISERLGNEVEGFLNAKKYKPITGRILTFPEAWRREGEGEQENQVQREPSERVQTEAQTAFQQRLLAIKSISDPQEQLRTLIQLSQELADQGNADGLRELLLLARFFMYPAQQVEVLVTVVEAFVRLHDTEGTRRVVEMILMEESDEVRDPVLEAVARAYERLDEHDKASEVASLLKNNLHSVSNASDEILLRMRPQEMPIYTRNASPFEIYTAYAQADVRFFNKLKEQLDILRRQGWSISCHESEIIHSTTWQRSDHLATAHLILLLISTTFLNSDFCYSKQMYLAVERHRRDNLCYVIPILLRPLSPHLLERTPFGKLDFLPTNGKSISTWKDSRKAYNDITGYLLEKIQFMAYYP